MYYNKDSSQPLVSVIILNYNGRKWLKKCLESILQSDYLGLEVIVSDNGSTDGSQAYVKTFFPSVKLIENRGNLGFAEGNNIAIEVANGDLIFLLNNDAVLHKTCIRELVFHAVSDEIIGILGCKTYYTGSKIIQHAGGKLVITADEPGHMGDGELDCGQYDKICDVDFVTGTALMIKKSVVNNIGFFDSDYKFYWEDVDLCFRARKAGFRVIYVPTAIVYHYVSMTARKYRLRMKLMFERGRVRFILKHLSISEILTWIFCLEPKAVFKRVTAGLHCLFKSSGNESKERVFTQRAPRDIIEWGTSLILAYIWNFLFLPRTVKARFTETENDSAL